MPEDLLALFRRARNKTGGLALPQLDDQDAELTDVSDSEDEDGGYAADTTHDVTNDGNQGIMDEYPSFDNYVPPINEELEPTPVPDARKGGVRDQDEDDFIGNSNDQEEPQAEDIDKRTGWTKRTQRVGVLRGGWVGGGIKSTQPFRSVHCRSKSLSRRRLPRATSSSTRS